MKWIKRGALAVVILAVAALLDYSLPHSEVVKIVGVESRLLHGGDVSADAQSNQPLKDVIMIRAESLDGNPRVYRNEDTGFSYPPYFKFNSETLAATAQAAANAQDNGDAYALVTSYGWRFEWLTLFPNVTSIERVPADYSHFPLFNVVFLTVLVIVVVYVVFWFRSRGRRRKERHEREAAEAAARMAQSDRSAADDMASNLKKGR